MSASQERRFGRRVRASFRFAGCGPSGGSPPPTPYTKEKKASEASDRLMEISASDPEWAVGFEDECWWSRLALPGLTLDEQTISAYATAASSIVACSYSDGLR